MRVSVDLDDLNVGKRENTPVVLASPAATAYRSHPEHRSANEISLLSRIKNAFEVYLSEGLSLRNQLVGVLREVLLGLQDGHDDDSGRVGDWWF